MYSNLIFAIIYNCLCNLRATKVKYFHLISKKRGVKYSKSLKNNFIPNFERVSLLKVKNK